MFTWVRWSSNQLSKLILLLFYKSNNINKNNKSNLCTVATGKVNAFRFKTCRHMYNLYHGQYIPRMIMFIDGHGLEVVSKLSEQPTTTFSCLCWYKNNNLLYITLCFLGLVLTSIILGLFLQLELREKSCFG